MNILVIDVGTSSMRGILFDFAGKKLFNKQVTYQIMYVSNEEAEQKASDWESALLTIVKEIVEQSQAGGQTIAAIALTAQRSSVIPVNMEGMPLCNALMWQDTRTREICEELGFYNELISERSGAKVNPVFSGCKMTWILRNKPEIRDRIHKFLNIPEYIIHFMTSEYRTDYTYGSRSNLMNLRTRTWDSELLNLFQVNEDYLCALGEPGSIAGKITKQFASLTGLKAGIPVISSGGDQQCAAVGQGIHKEGRLSIVLGTGAFLIVNLDSIPPNLETNIICNCSAVKNSYILEANVLSCSSAFDWFYRNFYDGEKITPKMLDEELAAKYACDSSCMVLPFFQGRSTPEWNPAAKAIFANITLSTERSEILKALIEGIGMELNNNVNLLKNYAEVKEAFISGGLSNSKIINQMYADIIGLPLWHQDNTESASFGALIIALCSLGIFSNLEEAFRKLRGSEAIEEYDPNPVKNNHYRKKQTEMNTLYRKIYKTEKGV